MKLHRSSVYIALVAICCFASAASAVRAHKYWIEFRDKGIDVHDFKPGTPVFERVRAHLSEKALMRRAHAMGTNDISKLITVADAPVAAEYVSALRTIGVRPERFSGWENSVSATLSEDEIAKVKALPFVKSIEPLAAPVRLLGTDSTNTIALKTEASSSCGYDSIVDHYGITGAQLIMLNVLPLHEMGFDGSNVILGMLDAGFNWRAMPTTNMHHVIGEYDFVFHDSVVANDSKDTVAADSHGSEVLSACTGFLPDTVIGPAYNATLILAKTEDIRSETPVEEDNYAAALEWMEGLGVEITSSSLGYKGFDSGYVSYTYQDMNGHTAICTKAAEHAASLGVLVCTAAGNDDQTDPPSLIAPSDADSILSCGAIMYNDTITSFSSNGPTSDGRIKPDICALGLFVASMGRDATTTYASGTSLSTPLVSGSCVLIKQAHPEASAQAIRRAVLSSGILFDSTQPNNTYGYGRIDAYNAALRLGTIIGPLKLMRTDSIYSICVAIAANNGIRNAHIRYGINKGAPSDSVDCSLVTDSLIYSGTFPALAKGTVVRFYVEATDGADTITTSPRNAPVTMYTFTVGDTTISKARVEDTQARSSASVFPNPSNGIVWVAPSTEGTVSVSVTDELGRTAFESAPIDGSIATKLDLSALAAGHYSLHIQGSNGSASSIQSLVITK